MSEHGDILVIDDEASLRQTLTRILRTAGCQVTTAQDGEEALRLISSMPFDLVYLDLRLPGSSGIQVLKEIRTLKPRLPVILLTAHGSMQSAMEALRLGATDYLLKPVDPEVLVARTRTVLEEQAIEKRRKELQEQIARLETELKSLEQAHPVQSTIHQEPFPDNRFLKRGALILDNQAKRVTYRDHVLSLPPAAFDYLIVLARHSPELVAYQKLVSEAQGYQAGKIEARELSKYHIHVLRQAIEANPEDPQIILNVRGEGYRLICD